MKKTFKPLHRTIFVGCAALILAAYSAYLWPSDVAYVVLFLFFVPSGLIFLRMLCLDALMFWFANWRKTPDSYVAYRTADGVAFVVGLILLAVVIGFGPKSMDDWDVWRARGINPMLILIPAVGVAALALGHVVRNSGYAGRALYNSGIALLVASCVGLFIELTAPNTNRR